MVLKMCFSVYGVHSSKQAIKNKIVGKIAKKR